MKLTKEQKSKLNNLLQLHYKSLLSDVSILDKNTLEYWSVHFSNIETLEKILNKKERLIK